MTKRNRWWRTAASSLTVIAGLVSVAPPLANAAQPCTTQQLDAAVRREANERAKWEASGGKDRDEFLAVTSSGQALPLGNARSTVTLINHLVRTSGVSAAKVRAALTALRTNADLTISDNLLISAPDATNAIRELVVSGGLSSKEGSRILVALTKSTGQLRKTYRGLRDSLDRASAEVKRLADCLGRGSGDAITFELCPGDSGLTVTARAFAAAPCIKVPARPVVPTTPVGPSVSQPANPPVSPPTGPSPTAPPPTAAGGLSGPGLPGGPAVIAGAGGVTFAATGEWGVWAFSSLPGRITDPCSIQYVASPRPNPRFDNPANGYILVRTSASQVGADAFIAQFSLFFNDMPDGVVKLTTCRGGTASTTTVGPTTTTPPVVVVSVPTPSSVTPSTAPPIVSTTPTTQARGALVLESVRNASAPDPQFPWQGSGGSWSRTISFGKQAVEVQAPSAIPVDGVTFSISSRAEATVSNLATECEFRGGPFGVTVNPNAHFSAFSSKPGEVNTKTIAVIIKAPPTLPVGATAEFSLGCFSFLDLRFVYRQR